MGQAQSETFPASSDEDALCTDQTPGTPASDRTDAPSLASNKDRREECRLTKRKTWSQLEKEDQALQDEGRGQGGSMIGLFCTRPKRFDLPLNRVIEKHERNEEEDEGGRAGTRGWIRYRPWGWRLNHDAMRIRSAR
jgi:hypothetical protein